jgi:hypothetical protein
MNLKSFGCSFIFGSDLSDVGSSNPAACSNQTWPAHLANHLNYNYKCYAQPGAGNLQIGEKILNDLATSSDPALYVIGWTWVDRFDYCQPNATNNWLWETLRPGNESKLATTYYKYLHTEYRDKLTTLMTIRLVVDQLKQKNYPFIMTYMDHLIFDQRWNSSPAVADMQTYIRPYTTLFEDKTFLEWSRDKGYAESNAWHPLEEAHRAAGDYIIKVFDTQKTSDQVQ